MRSRDAERRTPRLGRRGLSRRARRGGVERPPALARTGAQPRRRQLPDHGRVAGGRRRAALSAAGRDDSGHAGAGSADVGRRLVGGARGRASRGMESTVAFDVGAVRARFSALARPTAFFDGPGGTQTPDSVIEAIASYLRESNANLGGSFESSVRSDALVTEARLAASSFLGCTTDEVVFGQNMTTLNFMLSRTLGRELSAGDEIIATKLDHDANVSPWLELARDLQLTVRLVEFHDDTTLDLDDLAAKLT